MSTSDRLETNLCWFLDQAPLDTDRIAMCFKMLCFLYFMSKVNKYEKRRAAAQVIFKHLVGL